MKKRLAMMKFHWIKLGKSAAFCGKIRFSFGFFFNDSYALLSCYIGMFSQCTLETLFKKTFSNLLTVF